MNKTATHWTAALVAAFCFLALCALVDGPAMPEVQAQTEYRAELAAASMCAAEGKTAVWNGPNEIECLKESP